MKGEYFVKMDVSSHFILDLKHTYTVPQGDYKRAINHIQSLPLVGVNIEIKLMEGTDPKTCCFVINTNEVQNYRFQKHSLRLSFAKLAENYPPSFPKKVRETLYTIVSSAQIYSLTLKHACITFISLSYAMIN